MMDIGREKFNEVISGILNKPEYRYIKYLENNIFGKLRDMLRKFIETLFEKLFGNIKGIHVSEGTANILLILCIAVIASVLVAAAIKISRSMDKNKKVRELFGTAISDSITPDDMMRKSREYEASKDYRNAVKFSFIALLLMMHNQNVIFLDESKTNRELLYDLKKADLNLSGMFGKLISTFDACWYGHKPIDGEPYRTWVKGVEVVWEGVGHETQNK